MRKFVMLSEIRKKIYFTFASSEIGRSWWGWSASLLADGQVSSIRSWIPASKAASSFEHGRSPLTTRRCNYKNTHSVISPTLRDDNIKIGGGGKTTVSHFPVACSGAFSKDDKWLGERTKSRSLWANFSIYGRNRLHSVIHNASFVEETAKLKKKDF